MSQFARHAEKGAGRAPRPNADSAANGLHVARMANSDHEILNGCRTDGPIDESRLLCRLRERGLASLNQTARTEISTTTDFRTFLNAVCNRRDHPPLQPSPFVEPIEPFDSHLDQCQVDAVARALETPDLLLVQGLPGTGKTRTIVEMIRQALARGKRVLLAAPTGAGVDSVLSRLMGLTDRAVVRLPAPHEKSESLPGDIGPLTAACQENALRQEWLTEAKLAEQASVARCRELQEAVSVWDKIIETTQTTRSLDLERQAILTRRDSVAAEVRETSSPELAIIDRAYAERTADVESGASDLAKTRGELEARLASGVAQRESLRPLEAAADGWKIWSTLYWKAKFGDSVAQRVAAAQAELEAVESELRNVAAREEQLNNERRAAAETRERERSEWIEGETRRRLQELDAATAALDAKRAEADELLRQCSIRLSQAVPESAEALRAAREQSAADLQLILGEADFDRRCRELIERDWSKIVPMWRRSVGLVAAPLLSIAADPWLADAAGEQLFDLLIVDGAHSAGEAELIAAAQKAQRWIFVGEPPAAALASVSDSRNGHRSKPVRPTRARAELFRHLWELVDFQIWVREGDRLCCRLLPVLGTERSALESERVADRPEIELRILNSKSHEPVIAEVVFPAGTSRAAAKEYLFHEVGELPCQSRFRTYRWDRESGCLIFKLSPRAAAGLPPFIVQLGDGQCLRVHDCVSGQGQDEMAVTFSESAGWTESSAKEWVAEHLLKRDPGRTSRLERSYRHVPALAAWLNEAVVVGSRYLTDHRSDGAVQFEPVPRRAVAGNRRGGAGFEINLADPSQREMLPNDLASILPNAGYVNLPEAQAVADLLERLPRDHSVAVASPYAAQTMVLKHYCGSADRVLTPAELMNRECDLLVISLTRSHVSRAVTYGDDPATILNLFSRPRCRIVMAGDPGTLARRAQWEGAIDHFDEAAGERERRWVNAVLRVMPAKSQHARVPERAGY